ncbi:MAG: sigma 54-interacting transcriptional regulator [Bacillota bacterium]|nr:sigma 54-interacting transcriptional regulator [Bacillota bacterium]
MSSIPYNQERFFLDVVLDNAEDAIVYVDRQGIIQLLTQTYADFLKVERSWAIGSHVTEVIDNTRMHIVVETGVPEYNAVQEINGQNTIVKRIPVYRNGEVVGAIGRVIFRNVDDLTELFEQISSMTYQLNLYKEEFDRSHRVKYSMDCVIGEDPVMKRVKEQALRFARSNSTLLILGESGTGKDVIAQAVHANSARRDATFFKINCAGIPAELLESELFGYTEGAFTGALKGGKIGKFMAADGGTVLLDEVGELPMNMQVKLLRFLQEKVIEPIGSTESIPVDVRIIAATNRNLEEMVQDGLFRLDLYYRLNVLTIMMPPLRERTGDIAPLSSFFAERIAEREEIPFRGISMEALTLLKAYSFPGNVRELENIIERALNDMRAGETIIRKEHLPAKVLGIDSNRKPENLALIVETAETNAISDALLVCGGNKSQAARMLGISRTSFYDKLRKYNLI